MKKWAILLLLLAVSSAAPAGTMILSGLPLTVNTSSGPTVLSLDVISNGQLDIDSLYIWTYTGGTLDIDVATNTIVNGSIYDNSPIQNLSDDYGIDITGISSPLIWANITRPDSPGVIVGDIITNLGLTIPGGFAGSINISVLSENAGSVQDTVTIEAIPEPVTIAILGLGALFLRRRK